MSQLCKWVHNSPKRTLIAGDFNAHSDMWDKNFRKPQNEQDKYVENVIIDEELEICNNESKVTFLSNKNSNSVIDLVLSKHMQKTPLVQVLPPVRGQHSVLKIKLDELCKRNSLHPIKVWKKARWNKINIYIKEQFQTSHSLNIDAVLLTKIITDSIEKYVPTIMIKSIVKFNKELTLLKQESKKARRRANKVKKMIANLNADEFYATNLTALQIQLNEYSKIYKKFKNRVRFEKNKEENLKVSRLNHSNIFETVRELKLKGKSHTTLLGPQTPNEAVDKLAKSFFRDIPQDINPKIVISDDDNFESITEKEYENALKNLNDRAAPGIDGIPIRFVKNVAAIKPILLDLYNKIIKSGYHPEVWKNQIVQAVNKKNRTVKTEKDYRPITIISVFPKLLEAIVTKRIMGIFVKSKAHIHHHGGIQGRSTESMLRYIINSMAEFRFSIPKRNPILIKMDIDNAFPSTVIAKVLEELQNLKIDKRIINWINDYHLNRTAQIKVNQELFQTKYHIMTGLQQGGPLSSMLWAIYGNVFPKLFNENFKASDSRKPAVGCFVDDYATVIPTIPTNDKAIEKKRTLTAIESILKVAEDTENFSFKSSVFNHSKSGVMTKLKDGEIFKVKIRANDEMETDITSNSSFKLLGVHIDYKMSFSEHINKAITATKNAIFQIYKFARRLSFEKSRNIWYGAILPLAIYNIGTWITISNFDSFVSQLQRLQNFYITKVTSIERWERPNIGNIAIELNYMPIKDKVIQILEKAEKRAASDPRVLANVKSVLSFPSQKMFHLHSSTKFEEIKKHKVGERIQPYTKNNLTVQWYAEWKAKQVTMNTDYLHDLSPRNRLKIYADLKPIEARTILRARSNNLHTNCTRIRRGFSVMYNSPLCQCFRDQDTIMHLIAACPLLDNNVRTKIFEEMANFHNDKANPLCIPNCLPHIHSLLRSNPKLFPLEPD
jgi:hypothetical protein